MKSSLRQFDIYFTELVLKLPVSWQPFFLGVTSLGDPIVTIGIGIVVAFFGYIHSNTRLILSGAMVLFTLMTGGILKLLFARARPLSEYAANLRVDTFSFPSGHSSGSMIAYGLLAYLALKLLPGPWGLIAAIVCGAIIFLVGISRIYLGAHFPSDVLAGWLLGAAFLCLIVFVVKPLA